MLSLRILPWLALAVVFGAGQALAQAPNTPAPGGEAVQTQTLTQSVEPSFHIEPIVHRFKGRRGEVIPFVFEISSTGKLMDVSVAPVELRQEETGIIMHRDDVPPPTGIRLLSTTEFKLAPGESQRIAGEVTIPITKSNFLSFGILVKDRGQLSPKSGLSADANQTTAAVRFVTQYLLRVDIETGVQDLGELSQIRLEMGRIRSIQGMPVAQAFLVNPTDYAIECRAQGTIESVGTAKPRPFFLGLPCRRDALGDDKHLIRVMPQSRVRIEAGVESLLFPGPQTFKVSLNGGRRTIVESAFDLTIRAGDFPALETKLAYLGNELSVEPAQIELGLASGTARTGYLKFTNHSSTPQTLSISVEHFDQSELDAIKFSETEFEVKPGRSKTIRAILDKNIELAANRCGHVNVRDAAKSDAPPLATLPLSIVYETPTYVPVDVSDIRLVKDGAGQAFEVTVTNPNATFIPVHGTLQVTNGKGLTFDMADGYGRWIVPSKSYALRFKPTQAIPKGEYQVSLVVRTSPGEPVITKTLVVQLAGDEVEGVTQKTGVKDPAAS